MSTKKINIMKNRNLINQLIYVLLLVVIIGLASCSKDFLDRSPEDRVTADNYYQSYEELRTSTAPLYNIVWFDYNERAGYTIGDIRSNNLLSQWFSPGYYLFTVTSLDYNLLK